jgi:hypothetical protein
MLTVKLMKQARFSALTPARLLNERGPSVCLLPLGGSSFLNRVALLGSQRHHRVDSTGAERRAIRRSERRQR